MTRRYLTLLLLVAAIWGASFMFIKVAVAEMDPVPVMALRLALAALFLVPFLLLQHGFGGTTDRLRAVSGGGAVLGLANAAVPFTLIAWGEQHVDSGIAAIANAPVPIFVALLAVRFRPTERARGLRLAGILLGFAGVGVLAGFEPEGGWWAVAGTLAVTGASLCYAASNLYVQSRFEQTQPLVLVTASSIAGALVLAPLALVQLPDATPSLGALASVAALGIAGTAIATILYFRLLASHGASRASLVTYLVPPVALVYGVLVLDERIAANAVAGLALILGGVALGSGAIRLRRRGEAVPVAPHA
ncbi:MAG: DMT family transporter [Actinomycetota bacterium]|nr:DMT family transporter [Actinomycetota bacterium]